MKTGTRVEIVNMPESKKEFNGKQGVITSWKPARNYCGVKLDGEFREVPLMWCNVKEVSNGYGNLDKDHRGRSETH